MVLNVSVKAYSCCYVQLQFSAKSAEPVSYYEFGFPVQNKCGISVFFWFSLG